MNTGLYLAVFPAKHTNGRRSLTSYGRSIEPIGAEALRMARRDSPIFSSPRAETQEACEMDGMSGDAHGRARTINHRHPGFGA